jgi:hypothetical protein
MQPLSMRGAHTNFPLPSGRACCQSTAPLSWDDISPSPHWVSRQRSGNARGGRSPPDSPRPPLPVPCFVLVRHTVWAPNARRLDGECNVVGGRARHIRLGWKFSPPCPVAETVRGSPNGDASGHRQRAKIILHAPNGKLEDHSTAHAAARPGLHMANFPHRSR